MLRQFLSILLCTCVFVPTLSSQEFTFKEKREISFPNDYILEARFSPYRNYFAITYGNNTVEIYDKNWNKIYSHQANEKSVAGHLAFSPDEKFLAYAKYKSNNDIAIIRLEDKKATQVLNGHSNHIFELVFSHNGKYLISTSSDKKMNIWKREADEFSHLHEVKYEEQCGGAAFSFDDKYIAVGGNDRLVHVYTFEDEKLEEIQTIRRGKSYIKDVDFHPTKHEMVVGTYYDIKRFRLSKKEFEFVDSLELGVNNLVNYSPTGDYVVFGRYNTFRIVSTKDEMREEDVIYRHNDHVFFGDFSDDGKFMTSTSSDRTAIVWEITGVEPSLKSLLVNYLNGELTSAQKQILTPHNISEILSELDNKLTQARDEFETTIEFNDRRQDLSALVLLKLQERLEKHYNIKRKAEKVEIPIQSITGYNADLQIYKIRFMETEAGIEIPIPDAKSFKTNWKDGMIVAQKKISKDGTSYDYVDFKLKHPQNGSLFKVTPIENPFNKDFKVTVKRRNITQQDPKIVEEEKPTQDDDIFGTNRALIFATSIYDSYSDLANPTIDATTIASELQANYLVQPEVIENPTLNELISKIREYAKLEYNPNDHLLIFIAGHGIYDEIFKEGYVISKDSQYGDEAKTSYLSHSNLRTMVNNIPCDHILLIMDVCFGGTFDPLVASHRGSSDMYADIDDEDFIKRKIKYKTRLYLTSGGKEYVPDGRPGHHSPFARRLLEALRNYGGTDNILTMTEIIQFIEKVDPQPRYGEFGNNEPGSDFLIIAK